jgi:hypothetical protein
MISLQKKAITALANASTFSLPTAWRHPAHAAILRRWESVGDPDPEQDKTRSVPLRPARVVAFVTCVAYVPRAGIA